MDLVSSFLWADIIASSFVPIVIISACGILCLTFYNRLAMIITKLRTLQRERLSEAREILYLEEKNTNEKTRQELEQFLHFLEEQTIEGLKRAYCLQQCIFGLIFSIFFFILTSLLMGFNMVFPFTGSFVLFFYVLGLFSLLYGLIFAFREMYIAKIKGMPKDVFKDASKDMPKDIHSAALPKL